MVKREIACMIFEILCLHKILDKKKGGFNLLKLLFLVLMICFLLVESGSRIYH
jgi:hypothetical protein